MRDRRASLCRSLWLRTDLEALDTYLKQFSDKPQTPAIGNDAAASLIE